MGKVICDVCGTTYPDTAAVCPICGSARVTTERTGADATPEEAEVYTYVKGGRFSKRNVRKRNEKDELPRTPKRAPEIEDDDEDDSEGSNKALIAVVIVLVLAIMCVLGYIAVRFFLPGLSKPDPTVPSHSEGTKPPEQTSPTEKRIPCTGLELDNTELKFVVADREFLLGATKEPRNTTDELTFTSSDETVAKVSSVGKVTAIGYGECVITVKCGDAQAECKVICTFGEPTPTEPTKPQVQIPAGFTLSLNRKDFTISEADETWNLYKGKESLGVKASDITWTTSNEKVATVKDGVVTGVDYGDCTVTATIGDQSVSCVVRIRFHASTPEEGGDPENTVKISHRDVTIKVGETFTLSLTDSRGVKLSVEWTVDTEDYVTIDGGKITGKTATSGLKQKYVTVSCVYEENTYSCIVRVNEK